MCAIYRAAWSRNSYHRNIKPPPCSGPKRQLGTLNIIQVKCLRITEDELTVIAGLDTAVFSDIFQVAHNKTPVSVTVTLCFSLMALLSIKGSNKKRVHSGPLLLCTLALCVRMSDILFCFHLLCMFKLLFVRSLQNSSGDCNRFVFLSPHI